MGHTWTEHRSQSLLIAQLLALDGRALSKEVKMERKKKGKRGRERNNHWERNVLSTGAPANCLAHEFLGRVGRRLDLDAALTPQGWWISAQQTTAQFDIGFSTFFFFPSFHHPPPRSPVRSGPAVMDWHPLSVKPALWLFNEPEKKFHCSCFLEKIFN